MAIEVNQPVAGGVGQTVKSLINLLNSTGSAVIEASVPFAFHKVGELVTMQFGPFDITWPADAGVVRVAAGSIPVGMRPSGWTGDGVELFGLIWGPAGTPVAVNIYVYNTGGLDIIADDGGSWSVGENIFIESPIVVQWLVATPPA